MKIQFLPKLAAAGLFLLGAPSAWGQHLPEEKQAIGPSERIMSGIDVYQTHIEEVIRRLGKPNKIEEIIDRSSPPGSGTLSHIWEKEGVRLRASIDYYTENGVRHGSACFSVDVWGLHPTKEGLGITSRGLRLGDALADVERIYGSRFNKHRKPSGLMYLQIEWEDGTELNVDFDKKDRISHMQLFASIE